MLFVGLLIKSEPKNFDFNYFKNEKKLLFNNSRNSINHTFNK